MRELVLPANAELLDTVLNFIEAQLEEAGCPLETRTLIAIASEEVYVNIAHYAYQNGTGPVTVGCHADSEPPMATLRFSDHGTPYNPFDREDPDITLSAEDRPVVGLGIYMVKEIMDDATYEFRDGKNILTFVKRF